MDNKLQVFTHEDFTVRTITDDNGGIWFVAKDVAQALGYSEASNTARLFQSVPEIWVGVKRIHLNLEDGREQEREMLCLTEQGLYFFLGRSDKPRALPYQMWIAGEVVPSIQTHGAYLTPAKAEEIIANPDLIIKLAQEVKAERARAAELEMQKTALAAKIEQDKSKVIFAEAVDASKDSILIGNFAKLLCQNGIKVGQNRLFSWFREHGYLIACRGERWNFPKQEYVDKGYFEIKKSVVNNPDGSTRVNHTPKITGKEQIYFLNKFLDGSFQI